MDLASYVTSLAACNSPRVTTSTAASSTSANAATNFITDVLPEPAILIQDNGNDLEEEGGDDFVDRAVATTAAATAAATAATTQRRRFDDMDIQATYLAIIFQGEFDSNANARPPERLKGQRAQEEEAEGYCDTTHMTLPAPHALYMLPFPL
ncbi:hypothetical protein V8E54_004534 [Elaphomyces granulatus]